MKNKHRILSLLLALALVFSLWSPAYALEGSGVSLSMTASQSSIKVGEAITVTIETDKAFTTRGSGMTIYYDAEKLEPVYLLISMISGCAYLLYLQGKKGFLRQVGYLVPILVMMAIMNPMFNHEGVTVLWYLPNDNPITLEAICFGLASAVMMIRL